MLLVFFVASFMAISLIERQQMDIGTTESYLNQYQLYLNALSGEELAQEALWRDFQEGARNSSTDGDVLILDTLGEEWGKPFSIGMDAGSAELRLTDLQSRFNLNAIVQHDEVNLLALESFKELMTLIGISNPEGISEALIERLENGSYLTGINEIEDWVSVSREDYALLQACTVALPSAVGLNLNTASEDLWSAWSNTIVPNQREDLLLERERSNGLQELPALPGDLSFFSLYSEYFQADVTARFGQKYLYMKSILFRDSVTGEIQVLDRTLSAFNVNSAQSLQTCTAS